MEKRVTTHASYYSPGVQKSGSNLTVVVMVHKQRPKGGLSASGCFFPSFVAPVSGVDFAKLSFYDKVISFCCVVCKFLNFIVHGYFLPGSEMEHNQVNK